jgi:hypothetical protein
MDASQKPMLDSAVRSFQGQGFVDAVVTELMSFLISRQSKMRPATYEPSSTAIPRSFVRPGIARQNGGQVGASFHDA